MRADFAEQLSFDPAMKFMLPNPEDLPAHGAELPIDAAVARAVGRELGFPERGVGLGLGRVLGAAVPKAAVDEDGEAKMREDEVGADARGEAPVLGQGLRVIGSGRGAPET